MHFRKRGAEVRAAVERVIAREREALKDASERFERGGPSDLLDAALEREPELPVILLADEGDIVSAVTAMSRGALAYLPRPVSTPELILHVVHAGERGRLEREVGALRREVQERYGFEGIVGTSPKMRRVV